MDLVDEDGDDEFLDVAEAAVEEVRTGFAVEATGDVDEILLDVGEGVEAG